MMIYHSTFNFLLHFSAFTVFTIFVCESDGKGGTHDDNSIHKLDVWKVAPLKHGEESQNSKVTITTTDQYTLACVPTEEGRQQCAELAKVVWKISPDKTVLHYAELLTHGQLLYSSCTSDLNLLPDHIKHICNYEDPSGSVFHVFNIRDSQEGTTSEMCRTIAFALSDLGPLVKKTYKCDDKSEQKKVQKMCKKRKKTHKTPKNIWEKEENLDKLNEVVKKEK